MNKFWAITLVISFACCSQKTTTVPAGPIVGKPLPGALTPSEEIKKIRQKMFNDSIQFSNKVSFLEAENKVLRDSMDSYFNTIYKPPLYAIPLDSTRRNVEIIYSEKRPPDSVLHPIFAPKD